jgi:hypothetical protein
MQRSAQWLLFKSREQNSDSSNIQGKPIGWIDGCQDTIFGIANLCLVDSAGATWIQITIISIARWTSTIERDWEKSCQLLTRRSCIWSSTAICFRMVLMQESERRGCSSVYSSSASREDTLTCIAQRCPNRNTTAVVLATHASSLFWCPARLSTRRRRSAWWFIGSVAWSYAAGRQSDSADTSVAPCACCSLLSCLPGNMVWPVRRPRACSVKTARKSQRATINKFGRDLQLESWCRGLVSRNPIQAWLLSLEGNLWQDLVVQIERWTSLVTLRSTTDHCHITFLAKHKSIRRI